MCQIVEGHNITVPRKSGGAREALSTIFQKKWGGQGPPGPPGSATPVNADFVGSFNLDFLQI